MKHDKQENSATPSKSAAKENHVLRNPNRFLNEEDVERQLC